MSMTDNGECRKMAGLVNGDDTSYLSRLAQRAFGMTEPLQVVRRVELFAQTYDDLEGLVRYIRPILLSCWRLPLVNKLTDRSKNRHLDALAFEAVGASVNWYCAYGGMPSEAAILWTAKLCCCDGREDGAGVLGAITGLSEYVIMKGVAAEASLMLEMARDLLTEGETDNVPELMWLLSCSCSAVGKRDMDGCVRDAIVSRVDHEELLIMLQSWLDDQGALSKYGIGQTQMMHVCQTPGIGQECEDKFVRARELQQRGLVLAVSLCKQGIR